MKKPTVWIIVKVVLAIVLAGFVLSKTSLSELVALGHRVSIPWLLAGIAAFGAITWLTARRYWILIGQKVAFPKLLNLVILQNAVSNLVANSAGAASYVAMLRGQHQVKVSQGVTSLLLAKAGDLLAIWLALGLSSWVVWEQISTLRWLIMILLTGITGGLFVFLLTIVLRQQFVSLIDWLLHKLHLNQIAFFNRVSKILSSLAAQDPRGLFPLLGPVIGYSCLLLVLTFAWAYCHVQAFAVPIDIWPVVFMVSLTQLMTIIPVQVLGGLGVYDVTSMYLYDLFGISQPEIAPVLVGSRIIFYGVNVLLLLCVPIEARLNPEVDDEHQTWQRDVRTTVY